MKELEDALHLLSKATHLEHAAFVCRSIDRGVLLRLRDQITSTSQPGSHGQRTALAVASELARTQQGRQNVQALAQAGCRHALLVALAGLASSSVSCESVGVQGMHSCSSDNESSSSESESSSNESSESEGEMTVDQARSSSQPPAKRARTSQGITAGNACGREGLNADQITAEKGRKGEPLSATAHQKVEQAKQGVHATVQCIRLLARLLLDAHDAPPLGSLFAEVSVPANHLASVELTPTAAAERHKAHELTEATVDTCGVPSQSCTTALVFLLELLGLLRRRSSGTHHHTGAYHSSLVCSVAARLIKTATSNASLTAIDVAGLTMRLDMEVCVASFPQRAVPSAVGLSQTQLTLEHPQQQQHVHDHLKQQSSKQHAQPNRQPLSQSNLQPHPNPQPHTALPAVIDSLLQPVGLANFVEHHWEQKPLLLSHTQAQLDSSTHKQLPHTRCQQSDHQQSDQKQQQHQNDSSPDHPLPSRLSWLLGNNSSSKSDTKAPQSSSRHPHSKQIPKQSSAWCESVLGSSFAQPLMPSTATDPCAQLAEAHSAAAQHCKQVSQRQQGQQQPQQLLKEQQGQQSRQQQSQQSSKEQRQGQRSQQQQLPQQQQKEPSVLLGPMVHGHDVRLVRTPNSVEGKAQELLGAGCGVSTERIRQGFEDGYTLAVRAMGSRHLRVWQMQEALRTTMGLSPGTNLYLTPSGSQGLSAHFDDHCVFVLQLHGTKHWLLRPPEPHQHMPLAYQAAPVTVPPLIRGQEGVQEAQLQAGDLLYIPRGWAHQAHTPTACHPASDNGTQADADNGAQADKQRRFAHTPTAHHTASNCAQADADKQAHCANTHAKDESVHNQSGWAGAGGSSMHLTFGLEVEGCMSWVGLLQTIIKHASDHALGDRLNQEGCNAGSASDVRACQVLLHAWLCISANSLQAGVLRRANSTLACPSIQASLLRSTLQQMNYDHSHTSADNLLPHFICYLFQLAQVPLPFSPFDSSYTPNHVPAQGAHPDPLNQQPQISVNSSDTQTNSSFESNVHTFTLQVLQRCLPACAHAVQVLVTEGETPGCLSQQEQQHKEQKTKQQQKQKQQDEGDHLVPWLEQLCAEWMGVGDADVCGSDESGLSKEQGVVRGVLEVLAGVDSSIQLHTAHTAAGTAPQTPAVEIAPQTAATDECVARLQRAMHRILCVLQPSFKPDHAGNKAFSTQILQASVVSCRAHVNALLQCRALMGHALVQLTAGSFGLPPFLIG